jgi:putative endonuclease
MEIMRKWVVYILECCDGSLYTGITDDLNRRLAAHSTGKGAKYTRGRGPLTVRYVENCESHSAALRRECQIKRLTREQKINLCALYCAQSNM